MHTTLHDLDSVDTQYTLTLMPFVLQINKSQGQSLTNCGLWLATPCFSHGMLYVGCSRATSPAGLKIYAPHGCTRNVVYRELLTSAVPVQRPAARSDPDTDDADDEDSIESGSSDSSLSASDIDDPNSDDAINDDDESR